MIERLLAVAQQVLDAGLPFFVVDAYERALVLRFGKFHRECGPGLWWKIPFGVERVMGDNIVTKVVTMPPQSLTTADGRSVTMVWHVTCRIENLQKALLEVEKADTAILDACAGTVGEMVGAAEFARLCSLEFAQEVKAACGKQAREMGYKIVRMRVGSVVPCRALRIFMERGDLLGGLGSGSL